VTCSLPCILDVPVIETERLMLRGHIMSDFPASKALWGDASVVRYMGGKPLSVQECWARFLRYFGHWSLLGFGYWVVEERETAEFVGEVGFGDFKRDMQPALPSIPELGWVLAPATHGKGYATEAAQAALRWGRQHFQSNDFACLIHPEHRASIRVATKCGFEAWQLATYKDQPAMIFKLKKD
jgi:RimJ/RimL family protein N-acetyltransferase